MDFFFDYVNVMYGNEIQLKVYDKIQLEVDEKCGELTDDIYKDPNKYMAYDKCYKYIEGKYLPENFEDDTNQDNIDRFMDATDCFLTGFKSKSDNILNEIDKCIDEFEDKRT